MPSVIIYKILLLLPLITMNDFINNFFVYVCLILYYQTDQSML